MPPLKPLRAKLIANLLFVNMKLARLSVCLILVSAGLHQVQAQSFGTGVPTGPAAAASGANLGVAEWLKRMHDASRHRTYMGTFVVTSAAGQMASSRIWHVCDGVQQINRVESLTGTPRSTFRRNDEVLTFLPDQRVVRSQRQDALGSFPNLAATNEAAIGEFYSARKLGVDRVAGFDADVLALAPTDALRFGYRVWSEKRTGLVVKVQTLDFQGRVIEQAAFSELQLDAPVSMSKLAQMMANTEGYKVERADPVKTTAAAEGWALKAPIPGYKPVSCYKRTSAAAAQAGGSMQWIFSDGLASVSLFVEPFDRERHLHEVLLASGATMTLTRRINDWWLTAMGEVPPQALQAFAQSLERKK